MKNTKKKKRRSKKVKEKKGGGEAEEERKLKLLEALGDAFSLYSLEEAALAYDDAGGDPDKAAEILMRGLIGNVEDPSGSSSSSGSRVSGLDLASTSGSSEGFANASLAQDVACYNGGSKGGRHKKVVAATGTVSTVLGKGYVTRNSTNPKEWSSGVVDKEDAEQFLCSMLGEDCDLSLAVVRDVLCQCGYNIEKALDVLLELSASSYEKSWNERHPDYRLENIDNLIDRRSECTPLSPEGDFFDNVWPLGSFCRKYAEILSSSKSNSPISPGSTNSDLPQKMLESLFNIPESSKHDKDTMNWRNVVKKMQSLGPQIDVCPGVAESQQPAHAKGDEYYVFREDAKKHWNSMKCFYQKASTAYTNGDRAYAAYLSDQGKEQNKLAQKADAKASQDIFLSRNKGIENVITIDLHGQHVKPAMRMLKLHLLFGSYVPSVQTLRVITGCGSHGVGKSKLKQSVINLLKKEAVEWIEENRGTVLIKLNGRREFSFLDSDCDSDSN